MSKMEVILSTTFFYSLHLYCGILSMFDEKLLRTRRDSKNLLHLSHEISLADDILKLFLFFSQLMQW